MHSNYSTFFNISRDHNFFPAYVICLGTPNPPTNVSVTCGIFSITVNWRSEYNGGETQIFKVLFLDAKTNTSILSEVILDEGENKDRHFKTDSMNPSTLYMIFVNALNSYGSISTTENVNCTTETGQ